MYKDEKREIKKRKEGHVMNKALRMVCFFSGLISVLSFVVLLYIYIEKIAAVLKTVKIVKRAVDEIGE